MYMERSEDYPITLVELKQIFRENELFEGYGLVVIDGDKENVVVAELNKKYTTVRLFIFVSLEDIMCLLNICVIIWGLFVVITERVVIELLSHFINITVTLNCVNNVNVDAIQSRVSRIL